MGKLINIEVGTKFNRLRYLRDAKSKNKRRFCVFKCDCGNEVEKSYNAVKSNHCKSCGCLNSETRSNSIAQRNTKHSYSKNNRVIYNLYINIKRRCYDEMQQRYVDYGGRGIIMCDAWLKDIGCFVEWCIENGHEKGLQIDRIDNNGNYEPKNCRFVNRKTNSRNKRNNRVFLYKGEKMCIAEISDRFNIKWATFRSRIDYCGWSIEKAIETPLRK